MPNLLIWLASDALALDASNSLYSKMAGSHQRFN
jgi:hypothetical protein